MICFRLNEIQWKVNGDVDIFYSNVETREVAMDEIFSEIPTI